MLFSMDYEFDWDIGDDDNSLAIEAAIVDFMEDVASYMKESYEVYTPEDSGRMREAIEQGNVQKTATGWGVSVGINPVEGASDPNYPKYVDEGSGVFGPKRQRIYASHGNVIAFEKATGETVFTRYIEGQESQNISDKVEADTNDYIRVKKRELAAILSKLS
jgi:hypothetical protein